ncbi:MAG: hypothetical protein HC837_13030 [Chloroflexaceae bacterium]|nr:hypothetical protein [Chloroflexaceae bacterium]
MLLLGRVVVHHVGIGKVNRNHRPHPVDAVGPPRGLERRRQRIDHYLWDQPTGLYLDYHLTTGQRRPYEFATTFYPLWAGIASEHQAQAVVANLDKFEACGGLRTSTCTSGNQWDDPFGWAPFQLLAVEGLHRYGYRQRAFKLLRGLFEMVQTTPRHRLPEQVCGFERQPGLPPVPFYGSCAPQASASAVVFGMIELLLGLTIDMNPPRIRLQQPVLPSYLPDLQIEHLAVGDQRASLSLWRSSDDGCIHVSGETGHIALVLEE